MAPSVRWTKELNPSFCHGLNFLHYHGVPHHDCPSASFTLCELNLHKGTCVGWFSSFFENHQIRVLKMFWKTQLGSYFKIYFHFLRTQARFQKFAKNNFTQVSNHRFSHILYQLVFKASFHIPIIVNFIISNFNL